MTYRSAVTMFAVAVALAGLAGDPVLGGGNQENVLGTWHAPGTTLGMSGGLFDLDQDGRTEVLVGAPGARLGRAIGGVFVFDPRENGKLRLSQTLQAGDSTGFSYTSIRDPGGGKGGFAIGAVNAGRGVPLSGQVFAYLRGDLDQPVRLAGEVTFDRFGFSLASGDLNGDGAADLVVGAPFHSLSPSLYQKGAVYVFFGPSLDTSTRVKLSGTATDTIGFSIATGDVNGDGVDDLLLEGTSRVLGFYGTKGAFSPSANLPDLIIKSSATGFGRAIVVADDVDDDSYNEVAVGAYRAAVAGANETGSVFLVKGGGGTRTVDLNVASPSLLARVDGLRASQFGSALGTAADLDGDGRRELVVGAVHADSERYRSTGRVWVLKSTAVAGPDPFSTALVLDGDAPDMHFGAFVAADATGRQLLVGAPTERGNRGGFYRFDLANR